MSGAGLGDFYATYNIAWVLSFLVMALLACSNWPVKDIFVAQMEKAAGYIAKKTGEDESKALERLQEHFDLKTAGLIGRLERILFIFGVMFGRAFAIISGWLTLKAFNTWLEVFEESQQRNNDLTQIIVGHAVADSLDQVPREIDDFKKGRTEQRAKVSRMVYYHLYLVGNALSLMMGITLGFIGLQLAAHWRDLLALCGAG